LTAEARVESGTDAATPGGGRWWGVMADTAPPEGYEAIPLKRVIVTVLLRGVVV